MRGLMRRSRRSLALLLAGVAAVLVVGGASGSPTVTIGQTDSGARCRAVPLRGLSRRGLLRERTTSCRRETGTSPAGAPTPSVRVTQSMSMMVFRPDGFGHYTVVGESPIESLTPGSLNSFADVNFAVQAGDRLGLYDPNGNAVVATGTGAAGDAVAFGMSATQPAVGALTHTQCGPRRMSPSEYLRRAEPAGLGGAGDHDQRVARGAEREQRLVHRAGGGVGQRGRQRRLGRRGDALRARSGDAAVRVRRRSCRLQVPGRRRRCCERRAARGLRGERGQRRRRRNAGQRELQDRWHASDRDLRRADADVPARFGRRPGDRGRQRCRVGACQHQRVRDRLRGDRRSAHRRPHRGG